jgi:hypothetical protein
MLFILSIAEILVKNAIWSVASVAFVSESNILLRLDIINCNQLNLFKTNHNTLKNHENPMYIAMNDFVASCYIYLECYL